MKALIGKVVSNKMNKTVIVERTLTHAHPLYRKMMRRTQRIKAHSDLSLQVGDTVKLVSTKPVSKEKHFKVVAKI